MKNKILNDLYVVSIIFMLINISMIIMGKITWYDFIFYTSIIGYCDFTVAIYGQLRFATSEKMGKMVESVEDLIKKLSKKKGKKRLAKALKKVVDEERVVEHVSHQGTEET